ncbi:MAG: glycerol-3-phosphate 1-O-acyltransferase PlsY [Gaiellales bacterium]|nr:glycerol-3-phosphate 1-O-acyltransferase PlsY [Gaiellales bacterium]
MTSPWVVAAMVVGAYLLGSFSPSVVLGRLLRHVDLRHHGSGNPGTTNAFRVLGTSLGIVVMICDILKGVVPVLVARWLGFGPLVMTMVGLAAIVGHNYSIFLRGRGGKGIATTGGVIMALMPGIGVLICLSFAAMVLLSRIVSVGSLFATVMFVTCTVIFAQPWPYIAGSCLAAAFICYAHRGNLQRLAKRQEPHITLPWEQAKQKARKVLPAGRAKGVKVAAAVRSRTGTGKRASRSRAGKRVISRESG